MIYIKFQIIIVAVLLNTDQKHPKAAIQMAVITIGKHVVQAFVLHRGYT